MTTPHRTLQMALDALYSGDSPPNARQQAAADAIHEALAAPMPEPVAWYYVEDPWGANEWHFMTDSPESQECDPRDWTPLYAAPPAAPAVPLTDERLQRAYALGWIAAASWAKHDDLIDDIGSPAYVAEMTDALQVCGIGGGNG